MNLKEFLLNSRALNNYPSYANKEQRFSTLHEAQAIDIALGIATGMSYLQSLSVGCATVVKFVISDVLILILIGSTQKTVIENRFYLPNGRNCSKDFRFWHGFLSNCWTGEISLRIKTNPL